MKKLLLSLSLIIAFSFYALIQSNQSSGDMIPPSPAATEPQSPSGVQGSGGASTGQTSGQTASLPASKPVVKPKVRTGLYADGTYTGPAEDAYYGNVQVQISVQNGRIANVQFLDYPHDRGTSRFINSLAMPRLISETLQAQSANVDIVSGATDTSQAFQLSLSSAVSKARNS